MQVATMTSILTQATVAALNGSLGSTNVAVRNISVSQSGGALGSHGPHAQAGLADGQDLTCTGVNRPLDYVQLQRVCCSLNLAG